MLIASLWALPTPAPRRGGRVAVEALRNTLLEHSVLHADETPASMRAPGKKKTHKAYV